MIFAHGSRFGGHALFIKNKKLHYVYNFLGIKPEQKFVSSPLTPGKQRSAWSSSERRQAQYQESLGKARLYVNDKVVAEGPMRTQSGQFTLCGDGLCIGFDSADKVTESTKAPGRLPAAGFWASGSM